MWIVLPFSGNLCIFLIGKFKVVKTERFVTGFAVQNIENMCGNLFIMYKIFVLLLKKLNRWCIIDFDRVVAHIRVLTD